MGLAVVGVVVCLCVGKVVVEMVGVVGARVVGVPVATVGLKQLLGCVLASSLIQ